MLSRKFVTAGRAIFTVEVPGETARVHGKPHYTYQVRLKPAKGNYPDTYFVSVLTGPDNNSNYSYLGILNPQTGIVRTTAKSKFQADSFTVRLLNRVLSRLWVDDAASIAAAGFDMHHEGRCGRCGRRLTVPESIETGLGPECAGRAA
jgi:hypothetical protein